MNELVETVANFLVYCVNTLTLIFIPMLLKINTSSFTSSLCGIIDVKMRNA